jgi:hypothetical protein
MLTLFRDAIKAKFAIKNCYEKNFKNKCSIFINLSESFLIILWNELLKHVYCTLAYRLLIKSNSNCFSLKMVTIIMSLLAATASVVWTMCHIQLRTIWKLNMDMTSSWTKHGWHQIFIEITITRRETFLLWSSRSNSDR